MKIKNILWRNYIINIDKPSLLNNSVIEKAINNFWNNNVINLIDDKHIIALFRIVYSNSIYNTLGLLKKLNKEDKIYYINDINSILSIKSNKYKEQEIIKIIVSFGVRNSKAIFENLNNIQAEAKFIDIKESRLDILLNTKDKAGVYIFFCYFKK